MKYLILFVPFLLSSNWMSNTGLGKVKSSQSYSVYASQKLCEQNQVGVCWQIDGCSPAYCKVEPKQVDDLDKPILGPKTKKLDCQNPQVCQDLDSVCSGDPEVCIPYCDVIADGDFYYEQKPGQPIMYRVFCRKHIGFQQKTIQVLSENAGLKTAFEQAENQKAVENNARESRRDIAKNDIKNFNPSDDSRVNRERGRKLLKDLLE